MKDQINKLTEAQAKELLKMAMQEFRATVYEYDSGMAAQMLGFVTAKIESISDNNNQ
jgi:hypothetical protein